MTVLPDPGASRAVLIGCSQFDHMEQLPAVAGNLAALAETLCHPISWKLSPGNCVIVSNPASNDEVMTEIRSAAKQARDTLLVYYAGHGLIDLQNALQLALPKTHKQHVESGLPYDYVRQAVLGGQAERQVIVLDCCFGGLALGVMAGTPELVDQAAVEGSYLLAAASETSYALAPPGETYTAFTGELLNILRTGIPDGPELLELDAVYRHLRLALGAKQRPVPQARNRNTSARLALGRNRAFLPGLPVGSSASPNLDRRTWPSPEGIRTAQGFIAALQDVRQMSGLSQKAVSHRSGGRISGSGVSTLLTRETLPRTWTAVPAFLSACGVPDVQVEQWHTAWTRLRAEQASTTAAAQPPEQQITKPAAGTRGAWRRLTSRIGRSKPR
ncbi:peptidase C14 [Streptomyces sp. WAC 06783]|uniref:caspase family protein n=1 Tax=Streptomyces sp. WAC 06783 TaxID=2203211 RepID=UPI000F743633|nr:caspase family protein [Streptomyces sp. WAC 06783]RSO11616.1 peptidase C14 [Streptomyces sp. WAC 06783]